MNVQRLRQGYNNELFPSNEAGSAHFMYYADHAVVVSLLREQMEQKDKAIADKDRFIDALLALIPKYHNGGYTN